jgi:hypothetical protein
MKDEFTLQSIAKDLWDATHDDPPGLLGDAISVCEYASRRYGWELTVAEGAKVRKYLDAFHPVQRS